MSVGFNIKVIGDTQIFARLDKMSQKSKNLTNPLTKAVNVMLASINQNFKQSGRPYGWKPLKISTLRQKLKQGYSPKPLIRTGHLQRFIVGEAFPQKLVIGTAVPYAPFHQRGTRSLPQRKFLMFQDKDVSSITRLVANYLLEK